MRDAIRSSTFEIRSAAIPAGLVDDALRTLHVDLLQRGASASELGEWRSGTRWFPHLNEDPRILALGAALPAPWRTGELCDVQILLQFPHVGAEPGVAFHRDRVPAWARGRRYARIVGIALSRWWALNGGLIVCPAERPLALDLQPGDAVRMDADLLHSGGINRTGAIRYGVYFRWLETEGSDEADTASLGEAVTTRISLADIAALGDP